VGTGLVPCKRGATEGLGGASLVRLHGGLSDVLEELGGGEVEDLDTLLSSDDEPVELLGEEDAVNGRLTVRLGEVLALNEIPDDDGSITGAGGEVGGSVNHIKSVDLSLVSGESVHEVHVQVIPNLDGLIPRGGNADSGLGSVVELDAGDGISMDVLVNGMLALGSSVPDLDLVVESTSDDLSVIVGDGNGKNILGVTNKLGDSSAGGDVPESDGTVP